MIEKLKIVRIIPGALAAGICFYGLVVGVLYFQGTAGRPPVDFQSLKFIRMLTLMNSVSFVVLWILGPVIQRRLATTSVGQDPFRVWQTGRLIVLATREGSAFFGLVVCLLGVLNSVLYAQPVYWLNAVPAIAMVLFALVTFPRESDIAALINSPGNPTIVVR